MDGQMDGVIVLKAGGSLGTASLASLVTAITCAQNLGYRPLVVHGGGPRITQALAAMNEELPFVDGQRFTPSHLMPVVERVLCEEVNPEFVTALRHAGVAVHAIVREDGVICAQPVAGMGRTGIVSEIRVDTLLDLLRRQVVPVIAPVGTEQGTSLACNVNADLAASAIAAALHAAKLVFFTDVDGIYEDYATRELITYATATSLKQRLVQGRFTGGMVPKVTAVLECIEAGVSQVCVIHGGNPQAAQWATTQVTQEDTLGTWQGVQGIGLGTCIVKSTEELVHTQMGGETA